MSQFVVTVTRIPTNYNRPASYVVEAATPEDAHAIVKDHIRDLGPDMVNVYHVAPYVPAPAGRILGTV